MVCIGIFRMGKNDPLGIPVPSLSRLFAPQIFRDCFSPETIWGMWLFTLGTCLPNSVKVLSLQFSNHFRYMWWPIDRPFSINSYPGRIAFSMLKSYQNWSGIRFVTPWSFVYSIVVKCGTKWTWLSWLLCQGRSHVCHNLAKRCFCQVTFMFVCISK